jgi:hypothetical protein
MFFFQIVFDIHPEYDEWVVVLLHAANWALDGGLVPGEDAPLVEQVLTLESLIESGNFVKTHYTYLYILSGGQPSV